MNPTKEQPFARNRDKLPAPKPEPEPPVTRPWYSPSSLWHRKSTIIAGLSTVAIAWHLGLRFGFQSIESVYRIPLLATLVLGGLPLLYDLLRKLLKREFGSDLLGGISIITSILLGEYVAGSSPGDSRSMTLSFKVARPVRRLPDELRIEQMRCWSC